ncbi:MAG: prolipoprotein diacylglyceryl transferase [Oscillospiraceae bacterium]|nr:prolipoprotein diacylglyceryl transferase [Oscillospiraceae bacterium]
METAVISFPMFGEGFTLDLPHYITIFGFNIYIYGLFITAGFVLAGVYIYRRREAIGLTSDNILDVIIMAVPCGIVGARLYYAIFNAEYYFGAGKWLNIFKLREGGLAVYGGVIGGGLAFYIYSRVKKVPFGKLLDAAGFGLLIGQAVGRWGNFFNREAFGTETDMPWRMGLSTASGTQYVHPAFLYESLWNIAGIALLHLFSKKFKRSFYGQYFLLYVAWYGFGRFMIEGLRTDSEFLFSTDIRVSQLLAALSLCVALGILVRNRVRGVSIQDEPALAEGMPLSEYEEDDAEDADVVDVDELEDGDPDASLDTDEEAESLDDLELLDGAGDEDDEDDATDESEDDSKDD